MVVVTEFDIISIGVGDLPDYYFLIKLVAPIISFSLPNNFKK